MSKKRHLRGKIGMTLVELLVFMSLALMVFGTSMSLSSRIGHMDLSTQIALEALLFNKTATEELVSAGYTEVVNRFPPASTGSSSSNTSPTNFYKKISGTHVLQLEHNHDDEIGNYYKTTSMLVWLSPTSGRAVSNCFSTFLYQNLETK